MAFRKELWSEHSRRKRGERAWQNKALELALRK